MSDQEIYVRALLFQYMDEDFIYFKTKNDYIRFFISKRNENGLIPVNYYEFKGFINEYGIEKISYYIDEIIETRKEFINKISNDIDIL